MDAHPSHFAQIYSVYAHVPFCFHKCHYCDFYSLAEPRGDASRHQPFARALLGELGALSESYRLEPTTVFVGGGTPTLMGADVWSSLLYDLQSLLDRSKLQEFTVEANPETVTEDLASVLVDGGVDRFSLGAQSFQPDLLKALERWHDPASVGRSVGILRKAGVSRLNLDMIFAIPGQTLEDLDRDLEAVLALEPDHVSCYGLTYEPNTPLTTKLRLGRVDRADEELERAMYERVMERLGAAGFEHYEISNWARPGQRCLHNMAYWENRDWLGVGPSAASHVGGRRWKNEAHLGRYLEGCPEPPVVDVEELNAAQRRGEQLMLRLRLIEGAPLPWLDALLPDGDWRWGEIKMLISMGLLERTGTHVRLTRAGLFVGDDVVARLL
ncbi:radical SAM family heme chaperone HemW [Mucisphaera calidilacus]|uniref:Heme chaperone HemW n=1 Tax=Mucisphaera calidilacus TaxID=2527982 RepID=A0A518BZ83_9BACT|nr:radical SAM family heme chaperone HemW [Mucisphaera calidilacus]QDU72287.1 Oxygen-independent coproporphyrinogen-III oxidase-like protein [Mucisphaera calidilacus]